MKSNNPSWRHHYVPQFYLRQWTTEQDKALWCYERLSNGKLAQRRVVPRSTGFGEHLYTYRHTFPFTHSEPPDVIEKTFFQRIDDDAATALSALLADETLDAAGTRAWALFICSMLHRGAQDLAERDAQAPAMVEETLNAVLAMSKTPESAANMADTLSRFDIRTLGSNLVREGMMREIEKSEHVEYLERCNWVVLPVAPEFPLVTTDVPLIVNFGKAPRPVEVITCALSPAHLFLLWNPIQLDFGEGENFRDVVVELVRVHNAMHCGGPARYLYSRDELVDTPQVRLRTAVEMRFGVRIPE